VIKNGLLEIEAIEVGGRQSNPHGSAPDSHNRESSKQEVE
jgi:hypothetical protein